jgi:hypothetical protein
MRHVSKLFMALCLSLGVGAIAASAQIESDTPIEANIPHAFVVRDTTLPAGKYTVKVADDISLNLLEIRSADGHTAVFFETEDMQPRQMPGKTELVFNKVGDTYFLSEVFMQGDPTGNRLPKSRVEERLEGKGLKSEKSSVAAQAKSSRRSAKKSS